MTAPKLADIRDVVQTYYGICRSDMLGRRRFRGCAHPRQVGMYLARKHTMLSLQQIANGFARRDHTTVMHAIKAEEQRIASDPVERRAIAQIEAALGLPTIQPTGDTNEQ